MSCNIFSTQVVRDENGKLQSVKNPQGRPSKLFENILDHLRNNPEEPSVYDGEYISSLIEEDYIDGESIVNIPAEELALAYYSKIYTPTFKQYYGDWQSEGDQKEPTFEEVSSLLFGRVVENNIVDPNLEYDPGIIDNVINPMLDEIIQEGMSVGEVQETLAEAGLTAPVEVITRVLQLKRSPSSKKPKQLKSDILSEKYDDATLKAMYKPYGYNSSDINSLIKEYRNPVQTSSTAGTLNDNTDFANLDEDSQVEMLVRTIKNSVPTIVKELFDVTKQKAPGLAKGIKIDSVRSLMRTYRNMKRGGVFKGKGAGYGAQAKVLMMTLNELMPSLVSTGMEVTLHDNSRSYLDALESNSLGTPQHFNSSGFVKGNQIHIHLTNPMLDGSVAAHEMLHPILEQMFVDNQELYADLKSQMENDSSISEIYLDLNQEGTADPSMEEVINYVSKKMTQQILQKHFNISENVNIENIRLDDIEGNGSFGNIKNRSQREATLLGVLYRKIVNKIKKVLGIKSSKEGNFFDQAMNSTDSALFLNGLVKAVTRGESLRTEAVNNAQPRFSSTSNLNDQIINLMAEYEGSLVDKDGNPTSTLMRTAKAFNLSSKDVKRIIKEMYDVEISDITSPYTGPGSFFTRSSFIDRVMKGPLGQDGRKARKLKAYLSGKMRDILPDSMMKEMYYAYLARVEKFEDGTRRRLTHTEMAKDLLSAALPMEVQFYMLSTLLANFERYIDNDVAMVAADRLDQMRTSWGRMGRYLQDGNNQLFGGIEAMVRARNNSKTTPIGQKAKESIIKALKLTKEEVQSITNKYNDSQIKGLFTKLRLLDKEGSGVSSLEGAEVRSTVMASALRILNEMGINTDDIINMGGVQRSKGQTNNQGVNLDNLSQQQINKILDAYVRLARGNTIHAKFMFEQSFGPQATKKHWKMTDTLNQNAVQYSKEHALSTLKNALQDIAAGRPATRRSPVMYTVREMLQINGYLTDYNDKPIPIGRAARTVLNEINTDASKLPTLLEGAASAMSNSLLHESTRKDPVKKSQLKRARAKAYALMGKLTMNDADFRDTSGSLEAISSIVAREVRDTLADYFSNPKAAMNRANLAMRLIYQMGLPEDVALEIEKDVDDYIAATIKTEQRLDTLKKHKKMMHGTDVEKLMQLAAEGILDDQMLAATMPEAFGMDNPLPTPVIAQLRKLNEDYIRANTTFEKNKIFERAKRIIRREEAGTVELTDSVVNEIFYGHVLSGMSTMFNVLFGTLSYSTTLRLMQAGGDLSYILRNAVTNPKMSARRLKLIKKSIQFQFQDFMNSAKIERIGEIYTGDLADLKSLEVERDPSQFAGYNIVTDLINTQFKERLDAVKTMFKGTPQDVMKGAKMLVESIYSDDLGSEFANRKVANINGRRVIRASTALMPFFLTGLGIALGGGVATIAAGVTVAAVSPIMFSKTILVLDYMLKDNIERQSMIRNAAMMLEEDSTNYDNDQFFDKLDELLGADPQSKRDLEQVIDNDLMYALEKYADEMFENEGVRPNAQQLNKFAKKYRRRRKLEMTTEYANEYVVEAAKRQANNQTLTGLPAGKTGQLISQLNRILSQEDSETPNPFTRSAFFGAKVIAKLAFLPFANVMGHIVNIVYDSTAGMIRGALKEASYAATGRQLPTPTVKQWIPQENRYETIELSENEIKFRVYRRVLGALGLTIAVASAMLTGPDDDEDLELAMADQVDPSRYKNSFQVFGKRFRVTGSGGGATYGQLARLTDYSPNSLQFFNEETGEYENLLNLSNNIIPGLLLAPMGINTDKEIFGSNNIKDRDLDNASIGLGDVLGMYAGLTFGQGFNQSTEVVFKATQAIFMGSDMEDYERDAAMMKLYEQFTKPAQSLASSNLAKQVYKSISSIKGDVRRTSLNESNRDDTFAFIKNRFYTGSPYFDPSLDEEIRDPNGHPIYQNYEISPELKGIIRLMYGDAFDENRADVPLYKVLDRDTRVARPSGAGMASKVRSDKEGYEYDLPSVITNTVYAVSAKHRARMTEDPAFIRLIDDLMRKDVTSQTVQIGSDYIRLNDGETNGDFIRRMNNRTTDQNYAVIREIMASASKKAADEAKVEVFKSIFREHLNATSMAHVENWNDITDFMAESNMAIYEDEGDLVFSRGHSEHGAQRVRIPMERIQQDMRDLVKISNSQIPVYGNAAEND